MIVNLRGTSGAGKSTIVRRIMSLYEERVPVFINGRKQPIGYHCYREGKTLWVPGHYETDCGGTDSLPSIDVTYQLIRQYMDQCDVIYEGLITQSDVLRCVQLHKDGKELRVFLLNTSFQTCLDSIYERRRARAERKNEEMDSEVFKLEDWFHDGDPQKIIGKVKDLPPILYNLRSKYLSVLLSEPRFRSAGVFVKSLDRAQVLRETMTALRFPL